MGCFCRHVAVPALPPFDATLAAVPPAPAIVPALSAWLSARWLPPAVAWAPDPAWLTLALPAVPMPPPALATVSALVSARAALMAAFGLDPLVPAQLTQLARIAATTNLRLGAMAGLAADWRPWSALAMLNHHLDTIRAALSAGLFATASVQAHLDLAASALNPALPAWRALLAQLMALAPLLSLAAALKLDLSLPGAIGSLAATIRGLRLVALPALANPTLALQLIAQAQAMAQLQASIGTLPFPALQAAVAAKLTATLAVLPPGLQLTAAGRIAGLPPLLPLPGVYINGATMAAAAALPASVAAQLNWQVPPAPSLPLLQVGAPLAALAAGLSALAATASATGAFAATLNASIRMSPCPGCDAAAALAAL